MDKSGPVTIERLLRGISTNHVETVRDAWRDALADRDPAVAQIKEKLASDAWSQNPKGPLARYFGALLALLDELDKDAFASEVARLKATNLHAMHARTLDSLAGRLLDDPAAFIAGDIPVFVAPDVPQQDRILRRLERWSQTKGLSLHDVTRIDVIGRAPELDYLGRYNLFFSGIILTWPTAPVRWPKLWFQDFLAEFTFYHEVGHHALGHVEGGQVAEQEKEADEYAGRMLRNSRPMFYRVVRVLMWPFRRLIARL